MIFDFLLFSYLMQYKSATQQQLNAYSIVGYKRKLFVIIFIKNIIIIFFAAELTKVHHAADKIFELDLSFNCFFTDERMRCKSMQYKLHQQCTFFFIGAGKIFFYNTIQSINFIKRRNFFLIFHFDKHVKMIAFIKPSCDLFIWIIIFWRLRCFAYCLSFL